MAIVSVQRTGAFTNSGVGSQAVTWGSNTANGNLIVVTAGTSTGVTESVSSITDSQSNVYVKAIRQTSSSVNAFIEIWYAENITGGATPTVTVNFTGTVRPNVFIREYSGLATSGSRDQILGQDIPSTKNWSVGPTGATQQANELVIGAALANDNSALWTIGAGYVNLQNQTASTTGTNLTEEKIVAATGTQTATLTSNLSVAGAFAIATFSDTPLAAATTTSTSSTSSSISTSSTSTSLSTSTSTSTSISSTSTSTTQSITTSTSSTSTSISTSSTSSSKSTSTSSTSQSVSTSSTSTSLSTSTSSTSTSKSTSSSTSTSTSQSTSTSSTSTSLSSSTSSTSTSVSSTSTSTTTSPQLDNLTIAIIKQPRLRP
jgi:hypothetical protein